MQRLDPNEQSVVRQRKPSLYPWVKRTFDFCTAAIALVVLSPFLLMVALRLWLRGRVIERTHRIGRKSRAFIEYAFATDVRIVRRFPVLFNILRGDMAFIGPRTLTPDEMREYLAADPDASKRNGVRPGLLCDWWIRRHVNLDYDSEVSLDVGYAKAYSLRRDIGIILRSIPGLVTFVFWGDDPPRYESVVRILGVRIDNISMQAAIGRIVEMIDQPGAKHACFVNPHAFNEAQINPGFRESIRAADLVLTDGFGTKLAGKILRRPICQNLCGTDLFPRLCEALCGTQKSIYLLGGESGVADLVVLRINERYPDVVVKGCAHGHFSPEEERDVVQKIAASGADLLVVGMGVPKQDIWIHKHLDSLNVSVAMSFGGLFDYYAGRVPRAPRWVREMGVEWVYRLIQEPRRLWRRYLLGNVVFLVRVFREKLNPAKYSND